MPTGVQRTLWRFHMCEVKTAACASHLVHPSPTHLLTHGESPPAGGPPSGARGSSGDMLAMEREPSGVDRCTQHPAPFSELFQNTLRQLLCAGSGTSLDPCSIKVGHSRTVFASRVAYFRIPLRPRLIAEQFLCIIEFRPADTDFSIQVHNHLSTVIIINPECHSMLNPESD